MTQNTIFSALSDGRIPIGMQSFSGAPALIEIIGLAGFDFVMIDSEHASPNPQTVSHLISRAESVGLMPLVRVEDNASTPIRRALEAGAGGVIVPRVQHAADVEAAVAAAYYPPLGQRGMCPSTHAARYSIDGWNDFVDRTNREVLVIPLLETPEAIANVESICSLPQVRAVFFGPGDLGMALGLGGAGMVRPEVRAAFHEVVAVARRTETLVMAVPFPDLSADSCRQLISEGASILMHSIDELLFAQLCREIVAELRDVLTAGHVPAATGYGVTGPS